MDKAPLVGAGKTGQVTTVLGSHSSYSQWTTYYSSLTCTSDCRWCWRPVTRTSSTSTHTSYRSSSTDGVPSITGVGGYFGGCIIWDHSIRQGTQCGTGSCGGWGLVLDIDNIVSTHWMWHIYSVKLGYLQQPSYSSVLHQDWSVWDHDAEQRQVQKHQWWTVRHQLQLCWHCSGCLWARHSHQGTATLHQ